MRPILAADPLRTMARLHQRVRKLEHRFVDPGVAIYEIKVFDDFNAVLAEDAFEWEVPENLDLSTLVKVESFVSTVSSSGPVTLMVRNKTTGHDMLSTALSIDASELNSKTAGTPAVINQTYDEVSWGDHLVITVTAAGTGAKGLGVVLTFAPSPLASVVIRGAKGDPGNPGGATVWTGAWSSATTYATDDAVSHNGSSYVAITGSTNVEPGVTSGWETYWMLLASGSIAASDTWNDDSATTWTYVSATSFKITGSDVTARFPKGTRLKLMQTTVKYFVVVGASFSTDTTVTITGGNDYSLANAAITAPFYSYAANPPGYPDWFSWNTGAAVAGYSGSPTIGIRFSVIGRLCTLRYSADGTSNATTLTFTLPIVTTADGSAELYAMGFTRNNGTVATTPGRIALGNSSTTATATRDMAGAAWTNSGQKTISGVLQYEI